MDKAALQKAFAARLRTTRQDEEASVIAEVEAWLAHPDRKLLSARDAAGAMIDELHEQLHEHDVDQQCPIESCACGGEIEHGPVVSPTSTWIGA